MKAMIFAAGLGTRLQPITHTIPKPLVEIGKKPLLQHTIEKLKAVNIHEIVINIHHLGIKVIDFLKEHNHFGCIIHISDEQEVLLDTGGGLIKAKSYFEKETEPFLVCNADVFTNLDLTTFINQHKHNQSLATLAVQERNSSRYLLFDDEGVLFGWEHTKKEQFIIPRKSPQSTYINEEGALMKKQHTLHEYAFSGYHIIEPEIFNYCTRTGVFSMTDWYLDLCTEHIIKNYVHTQDIWMDIGTPEKLAEANRLYSR